MKNSFFTHLSLKRSSLLILLLFLLSLTLFKVYAQDSIQSGCDLYARNCPVHQSSACYGDYLVMVPRMVSSMSLYNLKSKELLCTLEMQPWTERRGGRDVFHANNSSFGLQKFNESDPFPLLYVSHRENNDRRGVLQVYRVLPLKSKNDSLDYDSLNVSLVQTIYYPRMTDENALGSPWTVIDQENNCMYTYSRNNRKTAANKGKCRISKFNIPSVGERSEVYLSDEDILDSYEVDFKALRSQGACIHNGKMYIAQGISPKTYLWLRVIDLNEKKLVNTIDLKEAGFPTEPEGCFIFENHIMLSTSTKKIFRINIPIE